MSSPAMKTSTIGSRLSTKYETHRQYLEGISTGIDLERDYQLMKIVKTLSNKYMSMMVIEIINEKLQKMYGGKKALIRCYQEKKKFFEMPLKEVPAFIDIFHSTIAYILPSQRTENVFEVIDVGKVANEEREIEAVEGQKEVREIEHEFEEDIIGFKLGYYLLPNQGNYKAVIWSAKKAYIHPFSIDESQENEYFKPLELEFDGLDSDNIERIYDFGARQEFTDDYEDKPEFFLIADTDGNIHLQVGSSYGKTWEKFLTYEKGAQDEKHLEVEAIHTLCLVQTYKIVGIIDKIREDQRDDNPVSVIQVFEFKPDASSYERELKLVKDFNILESKLNKGFIEKFGDELILDDLNNCFYMEDYDSNQLMYKFMLNNNISNKCEHVQMTPQIAKNLVANNTTYDVKGDDTCAKSYGKTRGLLYHDFCCADNLLVLLHGKVVSCFDLMDKSRKPGHFALPSENPKDPYNLNHEPMAVWMMDKDVKETDQRYKMVVAFKNGEVRQCQYDENEEEGELKLVDYLKDDRNDATKLPGQIVKIFRDRNNMQQPVYFLLKQEVDGEEKIVFSTIEFQSQTLRQFEISGTNNDTTYVVLNITDKNKYWQEIICINTTVDEVNKSMEQRLIHAQVRIGLFQLSDKKKEVQILNKEDLQPDMDNVKHAQDIFVSNGYIYFIHKKSVDKYCIADNSHTKVNVNENMYKMLAFDNQFFYWRTLLGGFNTNRYESKIYFDGLHNITELRHKFNAKDTEIFSGIYPHINKLQYDSMSDSVAGFTSFHTIKVFPFLHSPRIKVKVAGKRSTDTGILATQLFGNDFIVTLHAENSLRAWNLKTGKFVKKQTLSKNESYGNLKNYQFHQRIREEYTLLRSKNPITDDYVEAAGKFTPRLDWSDEQNNVMMYKYKILKISPNTRQSFDIDPNSELTDHINIELVKAFVGPHDTRHVNFGLYCGYDLDLLAFFWKDSQDKLSLRYAEFSPDTYEDDDESDIQFSYLEKLNPATPNNSKLSIHSPNFKLLIEDIGLKDYKIFTYDDNDHTKQIPNNLSQLTQEIPNFLTNDSLLFMTEDNIIKCYNFNDGKEEWIMTHCEFPGSEGPINLATLLKVGNHVIGENSLTYEQLKRTKVSRKTGQQKTTVEELVAPNNFNPFFLDAAKEHQELEEYNEIKIIQCHYKSKIELAERSYYGYFFNLKELTEGSSSELFIISTYSYYDWRTLNQIEEKNISIEDLSQRQIRNLSYVQLDNGNTLLHCVCNNKTALEYLYKVVQDPEEEDKEPFHVPLLKNEKDITALDLAMKHKIKKETLQAKHTSYIKLENQSSEVETKSNSTSQDAIHRKQTEEILRNIGNYPFGLFKVQIKRKLVEKMIRQGVMEFGNFIDNCAKTPSFLRVFDRAEVEVEETCGAKVFDGTTIWVDNTDILNDKIKDDGAEEKLITVKVLDLPFIHHYTDNNDNYIFQALAETENDEIFEKTAIKAMIEQKWQLTRSHIIKYLLCPYVVWLTIIMYYTLNNYEDVSILNSPWDSVLCRILIYLFVIYFSAIEIFQLLTEGFITHIQDFWNYLDLMPPVLIIIAEILTFQEQSTNLLDLNVTGTVRALYSFTAIAMWLRFLYFFRISRSTGYYIHMIVQVIVDMSQFFFIFFVVVIAFGHANYVLSFNSGEINVDGEPLHISFWEMLLAQYRNCIGDIQDGFMSDGQMYSQLVGWVFLIICTLLVIIVLLNLLISIVGATFGEVLDNKAQMTYKDLVQLIVENQFLIRDKKEQAKLNEGKYLMLVVPEDQDELEQQKIEQSLKEMRIQMRTQHAESKQMHMETTYQNERILKALKKVQEQVDRQ